MVRCGSNLARRIQSLSMRAAPTSEPNVKDCQNNGHTWILRG